MALVFSILISQIFAGGLPVVDTYQMTRDINDHVYTLGAMESVLSELSASGEQIKELQFMMSALSQLRSEINVYQYMFDEAHGLSQTQLRKGQVLADHLYTIANTIRRFKQLVTLASTKFGRSGSLNAAMNMLREDRERQEARFRAKMHIIKQQEEIEKLRHKIQSKIVTKDFVDKNYKKISFKSIPKNIRVVDKKKEKQKASLW